MTLLQIAILAAVQGLCELLPVSSSAHVILVEKMMRLDPTAPQMTLLLVMLHTGTMFAVIAYFWDVWRQTYLRSIETFRSSAFLLLIATATTGVIGFGLMQLIRHVVAGNAPGFEIEMLFGNSQVMSVALAAAGVLIIVSSRMSEIRGAALSASHAMMIGAVQGLCLPFRGLSRSGATISIGLALGLNRRRAEEFSFALAVVLTPAVIAKEAYRLFSAPAIPSSAQSTNLIQVIGYSIFGMVLSFFAGVIALRWLSRWLEQGRWQIFGYYCLGVAAAVLALDHFS